MHDEIKQISAAVHDAYLRSTNNSLFVYNSLQRLEKPSVFDPRGQAMLTLTGKI